RNVTGVQTCALPISKRQTRISRFRRLQPTSTCTSTTPMPRLTGPSRQAPPRFTGQPTTILQAIAGAPSETHLAIVGTSLHPKDGRRDPKDCVACNRICTFARRTRRSEEHTSELQSRFDLVCRLLLE